MCVGGEGGGGGSIFHKGLSEHEEKRQHTSKNMQQEDVHRSLPQEAVACKQMKGFELLWLSFCKIPLEMERIDLSDSNSSLTPLWSGWGWGVGWGSKAGSYLADPTSPTPSHCAIQILFKSVPVH